MSDSLYDPSPVQREFHLCRANEILFAGAAGPGKSLALLMDPFQTQLVGEHQKFLKTRRRSVGWAIHFRREFPMLAQTLDRAHQMFPKIDSGVHWNGDQYTFTFSCGYKYQFAHLRDEMDYQNYDSNQYSSIAFDELVQFLESQYRHLTTRLRSSDPDLQKCLRLCSSTNPWPGWVREYFVDPAPEGRKLLTKHITLDDGTVEKRTRIFIPATLKDNPDAAFRRQYEAQLQDQPEHIRQALLYGDWYVTPGAFFAKEWDPRRHVVDPFEVPGGWYRFRSMDWGYKSPGVVLWWAVDTDGDLTCYREYTFKGLYADDLAKHVMEIEQNAGEWDDERNCSRLQGPADTQIWEERGIMGPTIAETMNNYGVWWQKADKRTVASVQQLIRRLRDRRGERGKPGIRFFRTCHQTIKTVPGIGTSRTNPEMPDDGGEDHWLDAVRYACMYRPVIPKSDAIPRQRVVDELEERRQKTGAQRSGRHGYGGY